MLWLCAKHDGVYHVDLKPCKILVRTSVHFLSFTSFFMTFISNSPHTTGPGVRVAVFLFPYCHSRPFPFKLRIPTLLIINPHTILPATPPDTFSTSSVQYAYHSLMLWGTWFRSSSRGSVYHSGKLQPPSRKSIQHPGLSAL